ncbi:MAG: D-alanine--D-serine ligase VanG [Lachnospiraceae bacterium]|nr:D-alanine--D-serine ligase VanG [Lachnospiraceae bacterium]
MNRQNVAIFFGGISSEYSVSLESAYSVISNLNPEKYTAVPVGISPDGRWFYFTGTPEKIRQDTWCNEIDCIPAALSVNRGAHQLLLFLPDRTETVTLDAAFPVMHGKGGEDGTLQGLIEMAGIPLVGCGVLASALCMDKDRAHRLAQTAGVTVPRALSIRAGYDTSSVLVFAEHIDYPLFVKPVKAGSSYGVTKVQQADELLPAIALAFQYDDTVILEENIDGYEVGCAIMGYDELTVGEVDEIELSGGFFDFTEKYTLKTSAIHVPARIDSATAERIKQTARTLYRALGCGGFARVDMFLTPDGRIVFNEINTIPGFTEHSRFPGMMKAAGISFPEIIDHLIQEAMTL